MLNIATIMGRLTADPELRHTPNGVAVTAFTLAVERSYAPQGQERQTDFIDIVAWRGTAEFVCKYFTKGRMLAVTGSIQTRNYEDKQGNKRKAVEIVADNVNFAGDRPKESQQGGYGQPGYGTPPPDRRQSYGGVQAAPSYSQGRSYQQTKIQEPADPIGEDDDLPF